MAGRGHRVGAWALVSTLMLAAAVAVASAGAATARDDLVLLSREGLAGPKGTGASGLPSVSADGRYVAFETYADNLHPDDPDLDPDILVRDLATGEMTLASRESGPSGDKGTLSFQPSLSGDGSRVAFTSGDGLDPADDNLGVADVYVRDLDTDETILVSRASGDGPVGDGDSYEPSISADGRHVAFTSTATNLDPVDDGDPDADVYVRDLDTGETVLVSRATGGAKGDDASGQPSISGDGGLVAFESWATNLHPDDGTHADIFVRDVGAEATTLVSRGAGADGLVEDFNSWEPDISDDGLYVAFSSMARLDPAKTTNGHFDVFVRDLQAETTTLASRAAEANGPPSQNGESRYPSISGDGRYVAFESVADDLHPDLSTNTVIHVLVRDLGDHSLTLASRQAGPTGTIADGNSIFPALAGGGTGDGAVVVFQSSAQNLDPADADPDDDVYLRDFRPPVPPSGNPPPQSPDPNPPAGATQQPAPPPSSPAPPSESTPETVIPPGVDPPDTGRTQIVVPEEGGVRVRLPGSRRYRRITGPILLRSGTTVDVRRGRATVIAETRPGVYEQATVSHGIFQIRQARRANSIVELRLNEPLPGCRARRARRSGAPDRLAEAARKGKKARRIWVRTKGRRWRTRGRYATGTVRGTRWETRDTCTTTRIRVREGVVRVRDLRRGRSRNVRPGRSYTVRKRRS